MRENLGFLIIGTLLITLTLVSCATEEVKPLPPLPQVPDYVAVPHPAGFDHVDIEVLFRSSQAPRPLKLKHCDQLYHKLKVATNSVDEVIKGARELVIADPIRYHWCFYWKVHILEKELSKTVLVKDKQSKLVKTYSFLTPIAKAFKDEYNDSRYVRWAIKHYKRMSEWVFYRRLEMTPEAKERLTAGLQNPPNLAPKDFTDWTVIDKYNLRDNQNFNPDAGLAPPPSRSGPEVAAPTRVKKAKPPSIKQATEPDPLETAQGTELPKESKAEKLQVEKAQKSLVEKMKAQDAKAQKADAKGTGNTFMKVSPTQDADRDPAGFPNNNEDNFLITQ